MYLDKEPTQCIKIGGNVLRYGAESRKPSQCIKIGNACIKVWSRKPSQCIKVCNACIKIWNRVFLPQFSAL